MKIKQTYQIEFEVDTEKAVEFKNGEMDWDAYPNWDINYLGDEHRFIKGLIEELLDYSKYSGISVKVESLKTSVS